MTMQLLVARRFPRKVRFSAHLDTTKMDPLVPANPDPLWVLTQEYPFGKGDRRQPGETPAVYQARISAWMANVRADFRLRCLDRIDELVDETDPGVALAGEGTTF